MISVVKVSYLNTLPLFYRWVNSKVNLVEGHPSELVKKLREGHIQAGIVSSVEFLLYPENYRVVPDVSISSKEKACSVLIFSKKPLEFIESLYLTPASMTSKLLALYIVKEVYKNNPNIVQAKDDADALMLIGDEAIREKASNRWQYVYDLGEEWFRLYGLPFVFALFLVRRDAPEWLEGFIWEQCKRSKEEFFKDLKEGNLQVHSYGQEYIKDYFTLCLDYGLNQGAWRSLEIFKEILRKNVL